MSIIVSKNKKGLDPKFSKELFNEVSSNIRVFTITDEEWETVEDRVDHKKVLIAVYVRTDLENLVLLIDKDKFANVTDIPSYMCNIGIYPNILIDAGLVCGKTLIDSAFNFKSAEAMKRLVAKSTCYPVGAVETSKNYVLVFNVIISESLLRDQEISLKQGFHFCPIETLYLTDSLQKDISESLIIVKSEDKK